MTYLLRLVVPDRPGVLGAVATALGEAGADIVSLDVLERAGGYAVDDVVVALPRDRLPDSLITAAHRVPGVEVESIRPFAGALSTQRELELLEELAQAAEATAGKLLATELPHAFSSAFSAVLTGAAPEACRVLAASDAAPAFDGVLLPWMPLATPLLLPSEDGWLPDRWRDMAIEMMAVPLGPPLPDGERTAIVVGRSGGPAYRRSELLRLAHVAGIAATVTSLPRN